MPIQPSLQEQTTLLPISLVAPAFKGLNLEGSGGIMGPEWATVLDNFVFDAQGRPSARSGWSVVHNSASTDVVKRVFEYRSADDTVSTVYSTDANIYEGTTAKEGSLTITDGNIKFVNFNDSILAFGIGTGGIPAIKTGTGNFADITVNSGTAPTSGIGTAAFGRIWGVDTDGKTLRFSALLDHTRWASADGGGSIDFSKVWPSGQDSIVAIEELGGDIVIFGKRDTVVVSDSVASELGIDPTTIYVSDTIPGLGAVSQFAITRAMGDLWVLTRSGLVSFRREVVQRSTPVNNLSRNVQSQIVSLTNSETDKDDITLVYNPVDSFVLAIFPTSDTHLCFDTRQPMDDGTYRASTWSGDLQTAHFMIGANNMYGSLTGTVGDVVQYGGFDDVGTAYAVDYESSWIDMGQEMNNYIKLIKRMTSFVYITRTVSVVHKVAYDFGLNEQTDTKAAVGGDVAEWGVAEWNVDEWSGAETSLKTLDAPLGGSGQYVQVGLRLSTAAGEFALQQLNLYAKIGRIAT